MNHRAVLCRCWLGSQRQTVAPPLLGQSLKNSLGLEMPLEGGLGARSPAGRCCAPSRTVSGAGTVRLLAMRSLHSRPLPQSGRVRSARPVLPCLQAVAASAFHKQSQSSCAWRGPHRADMTLMQPVLSAACVLDSYSPELRLAHKLLQ